MDSIGPIYRDSVFTTQLLRYNIWMNPDQQRNPNTIEYDLWFRSRVSCGRIWKSPCNFQELFRSRVSCGRIWKSPCNFQEFSNSKSIFIYTSVLYVAKTFVVILPDWYISAVGKPSSFSDISTNMVSLAS